jgi:rhomboid family GlyGly-CTERM serine protease
MADAGPPRADRLPWLIAGVALAASLVAAVPALRANLIYDRPAVSEGQLWRLWTGHLVHFGWPHLVVDAGLLLIVGWFAERKYPVFTRWALGLMPLFVSAWLYWFDPQMSRYGGLSAVNLGLLLYVAAQGWQRNWTDWFWPAVIAAYVGELAFEYYRGGHGGGAIRFDDATVRVATSAHVASAIYALLALAVARLNRARAQSSLRTSR